MHWEIEKIDERIITMGVGVGERERDVKRENKVGRVRETDCDKNEATRLSAIRVWNILYFEV